MGNDARPSRRAKDDETNNSKGKQGSDKGLSTSSLATSDTFSLRRSSRDTLGKKTTVPSSPIVRKSERLEKRVAMTPPEKGKLENVDKKSTPSPLRRSDRGKSSVSPSSVSKKSDTSTSSSSLKKKKSKKQKSVKQLTLETKEVGTSEKQDLKHNQVKKKRKMDPKSYMHWFNGQKKKKVKKAVEDNDGAKEASGSSMKAGDRKEAHEFEDGDELRASSIGESGTRISSGAVTGKINEEPETTEVNCSTPEKVNEPESMDSSLNGRKMEDKRDVRSDQEIIPSMRKRIPFDEDSVALGTGATKEVCTSIADATSVLPSECISSPVQIQKDTCSKSQRTELDSTGGSFSSDNANLNHELAVTSLIVDRGEHEASTTTGLAEKCDNHMQQKESPRDLQTAGEQDTCFTCKLGGQLLCCHGRGCKRSYHPTCLDPPMDDGPPGVWYCLMCVRKKLESGVHSVSEGVESICNYRDVEVLDVDGVRKEREFYVKYKGLAHIHNLWVPERKLLLDAPSLVEKFNRESQVRFNSEWRIPHALLQKRLLVSPKQHDHNLTNHACEKLDGQCEWLVKWRGLDYEHATWELDNALLFYSVDRESLIKDYENRRNRVNGASSSKVDEIRESEKSSSVKLLQPQSGTSSQCHSNCPDYINKLHEVWRKSQNAVIIDEHVSDRIMKVISLIKSFQPNTCQPFLIISTSAALHLWDDELLRLVNVVVYNGNQDLRKNIRKLESNEGGCPMFRVLLTALDNVMEHLDELRGIEWESVIIDEQCTRISSHCTQIKLLATKRRLLLVNGQLKESTAEYLNLLSLLDSPSDSQKRESLPTCSSDNIVKLKEKFASYIVYQSKSGSSRFKEYWVPVQMSNVQLEQYCSTLISKSTLLCSSSKHDIVEALRDVLMTCRKCCNHPYIVDREIQIPITQGLQGVEIFNAGIKACGKLQLLEMMLLEIRKRGLRALILFQDLGKDSIGDILEDVLIQRFGKNTYERVGRGVLPTKKNAALSNFNNKECGRFVFLIEIRACLSSIKLSSVDTVIVYGSDWNPLSDVRALQKITLDSKREQITIFRLYSPYTLEEKVLILAKQGKFLDSNLQNISWGISHMLLMWGASYQFKTLDEFHGEGLTASSAKGFFKEPSLEDVIQDFLQILSSNGKDSESSTIINVQQVGGGAYCSESPLFGELQSEALDEVQPHLFWTELLEGKHPHWRYISSSSQRNRKRVQYSEESAEKTETESDEVVKKRKKHINSRVDPPTLELGSDGKTISGWEEGASCFPADNLPNSLPRSTACISETLRANCASSSPLGNNFLDVPQDCNIESEEQRKMRDAQRSLHHSMKPEILKLCKILKLSDLARRLVEEFLEYVMNNHLVNKESTRILQAFQISLCWTVASLLKQKIDHKESLALARQHLNFNCMKEEADFLYSMLRCLKKTFSYRTGKLKVVDSTEAPPILSTTDTPRGPMQANSLQSLSSNEEVMSQSERATIFKLAEKDVVKSIKEVRKKFQKQLEKLVQKHEEEKNEIEHSYEEEKVRIQEKQKMESAAIRSCFEHNTSMRVDKLKSVDNSFAKEFEELENQRNMRLKKLEMDHVNAKRVIQDRESKWVQAVESWARDELLGKTPLNEPVPCLQTSEKVRVEDNPESFPVCGNLSKDQSQDKIVHRTPETVASEAATSDHLEIPTAHDIIENVALDTAGSAPVADAQVSTDPSAKLNISDGATPSTLDGKVTPESESGSPAHLTENVSTKRSCEQHGLDESTSIIPGTVSSADGLANVGNGVLASVEEQTPDRVARNISNGEIPCSVPETAHPEVDRSSEENGEMCNGTSNTASGINQQDRVDNAANQNSLLQELSLENSSCLQPQITLTHGDPVPPNQAHLDEEVEHSASQPVEIEPSQSDHAFELAAQLPSNSAASGNSADVPLVEESEHQPSNEGYNSVQVSQTPMELVENSQFSNQAVSQPITSSLNPTIGNIGMHFPDLRTMSDACESNNRPTQAMPAMVPWVAPPLCPDPLQKEVERFCQEFDLTRKSHEDMKLHLKSECEKEIAQIHQKYELKYKEIDNEFSIKKKEFDELHNKLWLNKFLAEAFRSKCMEFRAFGRSGMQPDWNATFMQHSVQQQQSMHQNAQRPPLIGTSSTSSPATTLPASGCELNSQPSLPAPVISPHTTPPVPTVNPSSSIFPSTTTRPPQISSPSYSTGNPQVGVQIRARPPHLRASATSLPSHPRGIQTQPTNSPIPTSNAPPFLPLRLSSSTCQSDPRDRALRPETVREPAHSNLPLSALELLRNVDRRATTNHVSSPAVPDLISNVEQLNTSGQSGMQVNPVRTGGPTDVVYLSDDD